MSRSEPVLCPGFDGLGGSGIYFAWTVFHMFHSVGDAA